MSFMFKPLKYDDWSAINKLASSKKISKKIYVDERVKDFVEQLENSKNKIILIDGYVGADFSSFINLFNKYGFREVNFIDTATLTKSQEEIDNLTKHCLPPASNEDPVELFGSLFEGTLADLYDHEKISKTIDSIDTNKLTIIYGIGSTLDSFTSLNDSVVIYLDVIPKNTAVRAREQKFVNIGDESPREFNSLMRRNYFVDFEVVVEHKTHLLRNKIIDFYVDANDDERYKVVPFSDLEILFEEQTKQPFRCKPVYLEGIWGGEYIRRMRNIPKDISNNIAWIFEFIPMEVSIVLEVGDILLDIPFSTFLKHSSKNILGASVDKKFNSYFPIRFNYDDTFHSNGNMSIQVHPGEDITKPKYNELGGQDEAYYIVATGHDAKTYMGFNDGIDVEEFIAKVRESTEKNTEVDYKKYIYGDDSIPGNQYMIPSGTIHASGRNQLILELGSLTIGSYTYKIYDYNRLDTNGKQRPIHLDMAERVLEYGRNESWVKENIMMKPRLVSKQETSEENIVGNTELMYYETSQVKLDTKGSYVGHNNGKFTTITVVDGEQIIVYDKDNPDRFYRANYLDIITIPSEIENYIIENTGYQPAVVHKAYVKDNYLENNN